jgi:hypothetical protein
MKLISSMNGDGWLRVGKDAPTPARYVIGVWRDPNGIVFGADIPALTVGSDLAKSINRIACCAILAKPQCHMHDRRDTNDGHQ